MGKKTHQNKEHNLREYYSLYYTERITLLSLRQEITILYSQKTDQEREGFVTLSSLRALHFVQLANMSLY